MLLFGRQIRGRRVRRSATKYWAMSLSCRVSGQRIKLLPISNLQSTVYYFCLSLQLHIYVGMPIKCLEN